MENLISKEQFRRVESDKKKERTSEYIQYGFFIRFKRALFNNKPAMICLILLAIIVVASILAPFSPYNPDEIYPAARLASPSSEHFFGTDQYGRDVFSRILHGGRVSLTVGFFTMLCTVFLGMAIGLTSGLIGGRLDQFLMRFTDIFLALPSMLLMIILNTFLKPGLPTLVIVLSLFSWAQVARITRAATMSLKERDFVLASRNLGASGIRVAAEHIIPNIIGQLSVAASLAIANAILTESSLSYLGLGVQIPQASWGSMLQDAQANILDTPLLSIFPGVCIFITVLSFNLLGDVLSQAFENN